MTPELTRLLEAHRQAATPEEWARSYKAVDAYEKRLLDTINGLALRGFQKILDEAREARDENHGL